MAEADSALDGSVYNVATQEEVTILELVDRIATLGSHPVRLWSFCVDNTRRTGSAVRSPAD